MSEDHILHDRKNLWVEFSPVVFVIPLRPTAEVTGPCHCAAASNGRDRGLPHHLITDPNESPKNLLYHEFGSDFRSIFISWAVSAIVRLQPLVVVEHKRVGA